MQGWWRSRRPHHASDSPLPPLAVADRRLSLIRVAEAQVAANLARAQRLHGSILQAAFSG
jgi:hypothetical protein